MHLLAGTSGFSYKEWLGKFYPEKLAPDEMLHFYAERFSTVEINNTFYRMPAESMLERWAKEVPEGFAFTLKAPRRITHEKRLAGVATDVAEFIRRTALLEGKLGMLLFQLPPFLKKDLARLRDFLALIPPTRRIALEFRNDTWQDDEVYALLREHGAVLCVTDTDAGDTPFVATSSEGYLRLRRTHYGDDELSAWAQRLATLPLQKMYVYFMHEDDAVGTRFARTLMDEWKHR
jgi:uncharacterized protein YecE (DUF72 family)